MHTVNYLKHWKKQLRSPEEALKKLEKSLHIRVGTYSDRVILNYNPLKSPKFNDITQECRGLILSYFAFDVLSRSFDRFFNHRETFESLEFPIERSIIYEKIDGSLMNLYFANNEWAVASRKMAFAEGTCATGQSFYELFLASIGKDDLFSVDLDRDYTYIFEMVSPETRVVKSYGAEPQAFFLCARHKLSGAYLMPGSIKTPFGLKTPKEFRLSSLEEIQNSLVNLPPLDEGYVVYDPVTSQRLKIKNPIYVAMSHKRFNGALSAKSILTMMSNGEIDEYLNYFPEDTRLVEVYQKALKAFVKDVKENWIKYKDIKEQKEFAQKINMLKVKSLLFSMRSRGYTLEEVIKSLELTSLLNFLNHYKI